MIVNNCYCDNCESEITHLNDLPQVTIKYSIHWQTIEQEIHICNDCHPFDKQYNKLNIDVYFESFEDRKSNNIEIVMVHIKRGNETGYYKVENLPNDIKKFVKVIKDSRIEL